MFLTLKYLNTYNNILLVMDTIVAIKVNKFLYYDANDVKLYDPIFFRSCGNRIRNIIIEYDLEYDDDYIFCNKKTGDWNPIINKDKPAVKDKLFLRKKWVEEKVPQFTTKHIEACNQLYKIQPAPPVLELAVEEQFYDEEWIYPIEVRGKRNVDECYFSATDVGALFEIKELQKQLSSSSSSYIEGIDYKKFLVPSINKSKKNNIRYFLTYNGILHSIYASHNPIAKNLQRWATTTLFTLHVGTIQNKVDLFSGLIGTNSDLARKVFNTMSGPISCVYFITLGYVDDLRSTFNLTNFNTSFNNHIVCKYGRTCDFKRRLGELTNKYKNKNSNINLEVLYCSFIDDVYASDAEQDIRDIFNSGFNTISTDDECELVVVDKKKLNTIKRQYTALGNEYGRRYDEIKNKYNNDVRVIESASHKQDKENAKIQLNYERQLRDMEKELHNKELIIAKLENENLKLRLKLRH